MTSLKTQIQHILKNKSVMKFLADRGHSPVNNIGGGRYRFLCPFDDHKETVPSFVVFTQAEYENWYCFGCNRYSNIIHLVSYLDKIPFKEALEKLGGNIDILPEDDIKHTLERIKNEEQSFEPVNQLAHTFFQASWQCLLYSQGVNFDGQELDIVDKYYSFLDNSILNVRFDKIEESINYLPTVLIRRKKIFSHKQEQEKIKNVQDKNNQ